MRKPRVNCEGAGGKQRASFRVSFRVSFRYSFRVLPRDTHSDINSDPQSVVRWKNLIDKNIERSQTVHRKLSGKCISWDRMRSKSLMKPAGNVINADNAKTFAQICLDRKYFENFLSVYKQLIQFRSAILKMLLKILLKMLSPFVPWSASWSSWFV